MNIFKKRRYAYLLAITGLITIAVLLKQVWHWGGSALFFYVGAVIFGLVLFGMGFLMLFFPNRLIAFFGGVRVDTRSAWQRMEMISAGLTTLLVGVLTLAFMIYRLITECLLGTSCFQ